MTRFTDLPLPKEFSKKKKIQFFKAFVIDNTVLNSAEEIPAIDINIDVDRFFLNGEIAKKMAIISNPEKMMSLISKNALDTVSLVLIEIDLAIDRYEHVVELPDGTEPAGGVMYDESLGALNLTLRERTFTMDVTYFSIDELSVEINPDTHILDIMTLTLREVLLTKTF